MVVEELVAKTDMEEVNVDVEVDERVTNSQETIKVDMDIILSQTF